MGRHAVALLVAMAGCADLAEEPGETSQALTGTVTLDPSCPTASAQFLNQAMQYVRIIGASHAFQDCVSHAMTGTIHLTAVTTGHWGDATGPYVPCTDGAVSNYEVVHADPLIGATTASQAAAVVALLTNAQPVTIRCLFQPNETAYGYDPVIGSGIEDIELTGLALALQAPGTFNPADSLDLVGIILHELMHAHGYHHGDGSDAQSCGVVDPAGDPLWGVEHTVPYIMNACAEQVIADSKLVCGLGSSKIVSDCGAGSLHVVQEWNETNYCECDLDPLLVQPPTHTGGGGTLKCGPGTGRPCYKVGN